MLRALIVKENSVLSSLISSYVFWWEKYSLWSLLSWDRKQSFSQNVLRVFKALLGERWRQSNRPYRLSSYSSQISHWSGIQTIKTACVLFKLVAWRNPYTVCLILFFDLYKTLNIYRYTMDSSKGEH
jgi:hypothetical protein